VTAQKINEVKQANDIYYCEMCNRILYSPEWDVMPDEEKQPAS
jgi:predicted  nucleic acid-binding Zn-ribbon protein